MDSRSGRITLDPLSATISLADQAALEHALRMAASWGGRVVAVAAGGPSVGSVLRQAMAVRAEALRVAWPPETWPTEAPPPDPSGEGTLGAHSYLPGIAGGYSYLAYIAGGYSYLADIAGDEQGLARAIAAAINGIGRPDVVVCGDRSSDRGTGALPAFLAAELGAAQALGLVSLTVDGELLRGERRLDGGRRERLRIGRPAVCSVEAAGVRLRRASLPATLAAAGEKIPVFHSPELPPTSLPGTSDPGARLPGAGIPSTRVPSTRVGTMRVGHPTPYRPRTHVLPPPTGVSAHERLLQLTGALSNQEPATIVGPLSPADAADALIDYLSRHGYWPAADNADSSADTPTA